MGIKLGSITELATGLLGSYKIPYTTGAITRLLRLDTLADWVVQTATSFVPSGTGALTRTTQAKLRDLVSTADYSTVGNFNTAQAALTEAIGVSTIRVGTGNNAGIVWPSRSGQSGSAYGDFYCQSGGATFNGQFDPTWGFGYNAGRPVASEPSFDQSIEGHYFDGAKHWVEVNWQFVNTSDVTTRVAAMQINRANPAETNLAWAVTQFRIESVSNANEFVFSTLAAGVTLTMGLGGLSPTSRTAIICSPGGYAAPSNANANSDGDKLLVWNSASFKAAFGLENSYLWMQCNGSASAGFKWYAGTSATPALHMTLSGAALTVVGAFGCNGATAQTASTGYGTPTNVAKQASFDATAITLPNLAKAVGQLIIDLKAIGFLAA